MSEKIYRADFLWSLCKDGNIQEAGYEFANGSSQEYQEKWWNILVERIRTQALDDTAKLIGNDAHAISFQTMGQYRSAIIAAIEKLKERK